MPKSREHVVANGKPAFYACIFDDLKQKALDCGWALGLHGSLASDMDIMAMPWTEDATSVEAMMQALSDCFTGSALKAHHTIPHYNKPNGRVVYTMSIWGDYYLDINIIDPTIIGQKCDCGYPNNDNKVTECVVCGRGIERSKDEEKEI